MCESSCPAAILVTAPVDGDAQHAEQYRMISHELFLSSKYKHNLEVFTCDNNFLYN